MNPRCIRILTEIYFARPCWVCRRTGWCAHREPNVDLAELSLKGKQDPKV